MRDRCLMNAALRVHGINGRWQIDGDGPDLKLINDYLGHLHDRNYSPQTVRAYAFDLLIFVRWLRSQGLDLDAVTTEALLGFMTYCRTMLLPGQRGGNVVQLASGRSTGYAPSTINRRLAAISGVFAFRSLRDPRAANPVVRRRELGVGPKRRQGGLLAHVGRPVGRSRLRVREPRRLPRALAPQESIALLASLRTWRDRAIAGLMLLSGLRSAEVLGLEVSDVDVGRRLVRVIGKGDKERRVPLDSEVVTAIQTYLLAERPDSEEPALFLVAKGPHRGARFTPAGLRTIFRYHRDKAAVPAGHPHALRHSFGTALAEAGVDLSVIQALMGHDHVDSAAAYIHLAPAHLRAEFDAARALQRTRR